MSDLAWYNDVARTNFAAIAYARTMLPDEPWCDCGCKECAPHPVSWCKHQDKH